jgi:predicted TIM-barrel fold metal-dependent hydrolase
MIIDFHTHYYPEKIAERALESVASIPDLNPATDGTLGGLLQSMKQAGIDYSIGLPLANTPDNVRGVNRWAAVNNKAPVFLLGSVHPDMEEPAETVRWIASMGLKGVKVHPEYQKFRFDEKRLFPIWEACIENDLFVLTHTGADVNFPPPYHSDPASLAEFHKQFPELKLIFAHMGAWGMWDDSEKHLMGLPVYWDLAFCLGMMPDEQLVRMIREHGAQRVLFGTDSPWRDQKKDVEHFKSLPLSEEEKELILWRNGASLLGI